MSNVEVMYSVYFKKRLSKAIPPFDILRFDIRDSAVLSFQLCVASHELLAVSFRLSTKISARRSGALKLSGKNSKIRNAKKENF